MAYGSVEGVETLKGTIAYVLDSDPHNDKLVNVRNLEVATSGIIGSDDEPLYTRMERMLRAYPNTRRTNEAYSFIISFREDEYDVRDEEHVLEMKDHVYETSIKQFGDKVPYAIFIQADGEGGKLHAHVVALNINLETGKSIRGHTNLYQWRRNMNEVTREKEELNKKLEFPRKNAKIISATASARKKQTQERYVWREDLMNRIDETLNQTTAENYEDFVTELADEGIEVRQNGKGSNSMSYGYDPKKDKNGEITNRKRSTKASHLGTDYSSEGLVERFNERKMEILRLHKKRLEEKEERKERSREEKLAGRLLAKHQNQNQNQRQSSKDSYKTSDAPDIF